MTWRRARAISAAALAVAALALVTPRDLEAQDAPEGLRVVTTNLRDGFWIGFGPGVALEEWDDRTMPAFHIKMGGTPNRSILLGAEVYGAVQDDELGTLTRSSAAFVAQWYPMPNGAWYVKGGIGIAGSTFDPERGGEITETGAAAQLGVGYDIRVGRMVSLVPAVDVYGYAFEDEELWILNIGLGVTFH